MPAAPAEWMVEVFVTLKPSVLDPQGATVQRELNAMGYNHLTQVRLGKYFKLTFSYRLSRTEVEKQVKYIADQVLTNPVIEHYRWHISKTAPGPGTAKPAGGKKAGK